jgi:TRAP transporter 4TM/12TM fusion protein
MTSHTQAATENIPQNVDLDALVEMADRGGRHPGPMVTKALAFTAIGWSLFQLWYASPLPFMLHIGIFNDTEARCIHLAFALFLAFAAYPASTNAPRNRIPLYDWIFIGLSIASVLYLVVFYRALATRPGLPTPADITLSVIGVLVLLEASRRADGIWMPITCVILLVYVFTGPWLPEMISHKGASISRAASQFWLTTEGIFGVALGVSTAFIFLFVLFGALLEKAGAGNYFIQVAFSLLGQFRGGPAKAGVVSSGLTGMISGSSVANVVTTGTFTIPLMKRVGYTPTQSAAIESAAGVNGQLMPPVMGAAAFIMAEYVGIPYSQVVKHAFLPAIMTYGALFYIVDIEAMKAGMKGIPMSRRRSLGMSALRGLMTVCGFIILCGIVKYGLGWMADVFGDAATWIALVLLVLAYAGLVRLRAKNPDLPIDDPTKPLVTVPDFFETARTGLHYLLPVGVLIWCLMIEELSPGLSAFWGCVAMGALVLTQHPLTAFFRKESNMAARWRLGWKELIGGLETGGRNMAAVGIATAAAGIIVGTVTLTGIGLVLVELVEFLSGGNFVIMLMLVAVINIVLGTGLPTTASYVVVATLMAPVVVEIAQLNDLIVPLIAVHMFVFYFGLMADVSPPVGLAAYAAGAIAGADPMRVGWQATIYESRTAVLPFMFIFNTQLLMIDIGGVWEFLVVLICATLAMGAFVAATQRWLLTRCSWVETVLLLLVCFTLLRPNYWMDQIIPPYQDLPASQFMQVVEQTQTGDAVRFRLLAQDRDGEDVEKSLRLNLPSGTSTVEKLQSAGIAVTPQGDRFVIRSVRPSSEAAKLQVRVGNEVIGVKVPNPRPNPYWVAAPAIVLYGLIILWQMRRRRIERGVAQPA